VYFASFSDNIVHFSSFSDKIVYFGSYFRQDCVFCFIFQTRLCILLHFQTILCILPHISDKILYFASYFKQNCAFCLIFRQACVFCVCPVNFNCDVEYTYCHCCIFALNEKWVRFQIICLCNQCLYRITSEHVSSIQPCVIKLINDLW
jgi:hypothetical protein